MEPAVKQLLDKAKAEQQVGTRELNQLIAKIDRDIAFLNNRLEHIQRLTNQNPTLMQTYQSMLNAREKARAKLLDDPFIDPSVYRNLMGKDESGTTS